MNTLDAFAFCAFGRFFDIASTRYVTPQLKLESNSLIKKLGWFYAWSTILVSLISFYDAALGIILGTTSFFVAYSNMRMALIIKFFGEEKALATIRACIKSMSLTGYLSYQILMYAPLIIISGVLLGQYGLSPSSLATSVAFGLVLGVIVFVFWGAIFRRKALSMDYPE